MRKNMFHVEHNRQKFNKMFHVEHFPTKKRTLNVQGALNLFHVEHFKFGMRNAKCGIRN